MPHWEQYEVWVPDGNDWGLAGWFHELDVAGAVTRSRRRSGIRLIHTTYEDGRKVKSEVLADIGATREHP